MSAPRKLTFPGRASAIQWVRSTLHKCSIVLCRAHYSPAVVPYVGFLAGSKWTRKMPNLTGTVWNWSTLCWMARPPLISGQWGSGNAWMDWLAQSFARGRCANHSSNDCAAIRATVALSYLAKCSASESHDKQTHGLAKSEEVASCSGPRHGQDMDAAIGPSATFDVRWSSFPALWCRAHGTLVCRVLGVKSLGRRPTQSSGCWFESLGIQRQPLLHECNLRVVKKHFILGSWIEKKCFVELSTCQVILHI